MSSHTVPGPSKEEQETSDGACDSPHVRFVVSASKKNLKTEMPESSCSQSSVTFGTINAKAKASFDVRLKMIPVTVCSDSGRKHEKVYAFLDEGSDTTLCTDAFMKRLSVKGKSVQYTLSTLGRVDNKQGFETRLNVRGYGEQAIINLRSVLSVPHLSELKQSIPSPRDEAIHAEVLRGISFPDVKGKVEVLADVAEAHRTLEFRINSLGIPIFYFYFILIFISIFILLTRRKATEALYIG